MKKNLLVLLALIATSSLAAQVTVGSELIPNEGALLDVKEFATTNSQSDGSSTSTKGFNLPRVALQSASVLEPCATTNATNKENHVGLVVYNTTTNMELTSGFYYWNGENWIRMVTELPKNGINMVNLASVTKTKEGDLNGDGGVFLDFGTIKIPDDGSYAFNFRFYGHVRNVISATRAVYYISVWVGATLKDIAEINMFPTTDGPQTYSIALGSSFSAGDIVIFKLSHYIPQPYPWELHVGNDKVANRTSMIWWKL
ncbi:hypothetical protein [Dysgonomonas sp. 520]|uniref:hypothetical protein n=1 Tax=Dysgonomonas sp. 520 TaxID=2302931 RepID=UPI0013D74B44|nr:hypothetical protein [Dysgonomonas sp. 520]